MVTWNTPDKHFGWFANLAYGYFMCFSLLFLMVTWNTPDKHFGWYANLAYGYFMCLYLLFFNGRLYKVNIL
jgi:hypothetical protein